MDFSKENVHAVLSTLAHPTKGANLVAAGTLRKVAACDGFVAISLNIDDLSPPDRAAVIASVEAAIKAAAAREGLKLQSVTVESAGAAGGANSAPRSVSLGMAPGQKPPAAPSQQPAGQPAQPTQQSTAPSLPGVKTVIAVGAGKGGVGKSTVSVNLAVGLALRGYAVGLLDGDIYGPSLPTMLGLDAMDVNIRGNMLQPFMVHGLKAMTIGKLVDPEKALIWRGPMAHGAFKQLVDQTEWGELDYLIIDLPPGTGDVSLTMAQMLRLTGAVVVCTPQKVAQDDAVRAIRMFQQLGIDVLGIVENMSYFIGDDGKEYDLFGKGGAQMLAQRMGLPFLGAIPINTALRKHCDSGEPTKNFVAGSQLARDIDHVVQQVEGQVALAQFRSAGAMPTLTIS